MFRHNTRMKLSTQTLALLKNFAAIQPNIIVKPGNVIQTISEAKNILASATLEESFTTQFGIYDLNEFLSALSLVDNAELEFDDSSVHIKSGRTSVQYYYADASVLTSPTQKITLPSPDVVITLSEDALSKAKRASSVLGHATLLISGADGVISITVADQKNSTANKYSVIIDENNECKNDFKLAFAIGNLKIVSGDYTVSIAGNSKGRFISSFKHLSLPVEYWIALDETSTFSK